MGMKLLLRSLFLFLFITLTSAGLPAGADEAKKIEFIVIHEAEFAGSVPVRVEKLMVDGHRAAEPDLVIGSIKSVSLPKLPDRDHHEVLIRLTADGGKKFSDLTKDNIGKKIMVVICDKPIIAPKVMDRITGGNVMVSTSDPEEAEELAKVLEALVPKEAEAEDAEVKE